jgi:hypothetical protein
MFFRIDMQKAIEASATLLRLAHGRVMDRKRLLALLFLADRESLKETGRPIIGGKLSAVSVTKISRFVLIQALFLATSRLLRALRYECYL